MIFTIVLYKTQQIPQIQTWPRVTSLTRVKKWALVKLSRINAKKSPFLCNLPNSGKSSSRFHKIFGVVVILSVKTYNCYNRWVKHHPFSIAFFSGKFEKWESCSFETFDKLHVWFSFTHCIMSSRKVFHWNWPSTAGRYEVARENTWNWCEILKYMKLFYFLKLKYLK